MREVHYGKKNYGNIRVVNTKINTNRATQIWVESSWNVMVHGDAREGKWRENWWMEWVASTLYTTSEHGVCSITTADVHTSAVSSQLNWRTRPFRRKTKYGFCVCAVTFQTQSTSSAVGWNKVERKFDGFGGFQDLLNTYWPSVNSPAFKQVKLSDNPRTWTGFLFKTHRWQKSINFPYADFH
jgi:hypothetical protein